MASENKDIDDILGEETRVDYIEERNFLLQEIPYATVRRAWFTLSHLLLDEGSKVVDLGCEDGTLTYAMAALNPKVKFIGVDKSKRVIREAKQKYQLHNLEYKVGDVSGEIFDENSLDAVINSFTLHQVYSNSRYNQRIVSDTLRKQFSMLKEDGIMFIRDYAKPDADEYVLMEMHDKDSASEELADLSEADLLVWYSEHAQPKQDPGCGGFFLEELPPRFPRTRLFRLPYKWAYEFIMRKDDRDLWEQELPFEYTVFTVDEFRHELSGMGAQMLYSAPHWDEEHIRRHFEGHFRLMRNNGDIISDPPTSFIAIARKRPEKSSLFVKERRIAYDEEGDLEIKTLRDQKNGEILDVVTRGMEFAEILPYRTDDEGRLYVYLHDGIIRGISNAISRSGHNIDGREWSSHMTEAISVENRRILDLEEIDANNTRQFVKSYIGLTTKSGAIIEKGAFYYPDPNYIDERVNTYFIEINEDKKKRFAPKRRILEAHDFKEKGVIREFNAQNILDAITAGVIPNARLELQILSLMQHVGIKAENWVRKEIAVARGEISQTFDVREFMRQASHSDKRFKEVKGSAGQLRAINSIFVEEGHSQGGKAGISNETIDFVLSDDKTINTAVCLPITSSMKKDLYAGFTVKHMPVPQRYEGNGLSLSVPQFNIPKEIKDYRTLKQFIAEKFGVTPNMVIKLGESYFTHVGITPHRIHPFAIAAPPDAFKDPNTRFMPMYQYMILWRSLSKEQHFMTTIARAYMKMPEHIKLEAKRNVKAIVKNIFQAAQPDWSLPISIEQSHEEIMNAKKSKAEKDDEAILKDDDKSKKKKKRSKKTDHKKPKIKDVIENSADHEEESNDQTIDLINDFRGELEELRKVLEDDRNDSKPEPEEW
ncbi:MAG: class I SAM-dependent methyltransferase [Alcanivorax sp.]